MWKRPSLPSPQTLLPVYETLIYLKTYKYYSWKPGPRIYLYLSPSHPIRFSMPWHMNFELECIRCQQLTTAFNIAELQWPGTASGIPPNAHNLYMHSSGPLFVFLHFCIRVHLSSALLSTAWQIAPKEKATENLIFVTKRTSLKSVQANNYN